jgi:hypothetical protein
MLAALGGACCGRFGRRAPSSALRIKSPSTWPATVLAAAVLSGWVFVLVDAAERTGWAYFRAGRHWAAMFGLYALAASLVAPLIVALHAIEKRLTARLERRWSRAHRVAAPVYYGLVAALASAPTAVWTFSGERIGQTLLGRVGPIAFTGAVAMGTATLVIAARFARREASQGRARAALGAAGALALVAACAIYVDLTMYVALYGRLHTLLEVSAGLVLGVAFVLVFCVLLVRWPGLSSVLVGLSSVVLFWSLAVLVVRPFRTWIDDALQHVWLEELYAGRMLRRLQVAEAFLSNPRGWRGIEMARIERLRKRYDITSTTLSQSWMRPSPEPPEETAALRELRTAAKPGILIYYVDTLRYDVAADPMLMPNAVNFARGALDFRRAYAPGSDTLRSLPGLTGGKYDLAEVPENDLLLIARRNGVPSWLFIAKSAFEFLAKLRPGFRFDRTVTVEDYPPDREVWGYGAETPTAAALVDETLAWLADHGSEPFLLWLFNFDQHNWRELDQRYIDETARRFAVPEDGQLNWRYRVVSRAVDAEFGRLLKGIDDLGLENRLIVLFVSDHGEALGRDGFWVHSVFLWEPLVRVPLVLRVPGVPAKAYDGVVSLVDVAPTLGRYLQPDLDVSTYHGEDLLSFAVTQKAERRRPALLSSASKDILVRVGVVEPKGRFKLVLSLEAALPELYDLASPDPDGVNRAEEHRALTLRLLTGLVQSPVFPRTPDDFDSTRLPRQP